MFNDISVSSSSCVVLLFPDPPQDDMAVLNSECEENSDCTHDAMCIDRGVIGKHCFCYETGQICNARPKPGKQH